ncbi:surface antigen [Plasmodium falciparum UGT5.1]|uniref:Surface antigen n=1 Tax=Plasmodium falciparum UGT5.1 TaxID=1237627 RepID=W7J6R2_PLAFA|nr:surface antigen [Plasmodium falciparum UGT5.1]
MKIHYINILLFALPLNILVTSYHIYNQRNHNSTTPHTPKATTRTLCECELYAPANYDSDPEMKRVMQDFDRQTSQRFHEYDERMKTTRQKCKDRCDKEIQKIILKDKLEKQMEEQLTTLETKIDTDDIPTCVCEKSVADKMEKGCLKCAQNLGGIVAPSSGVLAGIAEGALYAWKPAALDAAIKAALNAGATKIAAAGIKAGKEVIIGGLETLNIAELKIAPWEPYFTTGYNVNVTQLANVIYVKRQTMCGATQQLSNEMCEQIGISIGAIAESDPQPPPGTVPIVQRLNGIVQETKDAAAEAAKAAEKGVSAQITEKETGVINTIFMSNQTAITASVIAIVVIVLIMVIIYLILRYRRKKKMKKKLQYIKLLEE